MLAVVGDYNISSVVDAGDYVVWRKTLNKSVGTPFSGADGDGNGTIGSGDYSVWRNSFGNGQDDFGNNAATATHIPSVPFTRHGVIEVPGDVDWFAFTATAGTAYDLSTTLGSLSDSVLRLIGTDGVTQIARNDNGIGLASFIYWTAPANGTYYIEVSGAGLLSGSYDLTVVMPPTITSNGGSDHANVQVVEGNTAVTTVQASGNTPVTYTITGGTDHARFSLNSSTGVLSFVQAPNYDTPTDANGDEDYVVEVTAANDFGRDVQIITVAVRNNSANDTTIAAPSQALLDAFSDYGTIGSAHFGMMTYVPLSVTPWEVTQGADTAVFDPGANFSWLDYLTKMKSIGCKAVMLTTKHVDGFCLWQSTVASDFCVASTSWFADNGQIDVLAEFCNTARALGMDVGFYFSLWDAFQQTKAGGSFNGAYRTAMYGEINELMTQFGDIKFILFDAWGPFWAQFNGPTYDDIPYATVYNFVKARQPNCLVGVNNHESSSGDFWIFEGPVEGTPPTGVNAKPQFYWQPMQATDKWFSHSDSVVEDVAADVSLNAQRRDQMHTQGDLWVPNISPGPDGKLSADLSQILTQLALPAGASAFAAGLEAPTARASEVAPIGTQMVDSESGHDAPLAFTYSLTRNTANAWELGNVAGTIDTATERGIVTGPEFEFAFNASADNLLLAGLPALINWDTKSNLVRMTNIDEDKDAVPIGVIDSYFDTFKQDKWNMLLSDLG